MTTGTPLHEVLVTLHGREQAADILSRLFLTAEWPSCGGPHTKKCNCGGSPAELFSAETIGIVRGWVADLTGPTSR
jgi:hypothetical protein